MATDYDAPRKNDDDVSEDSLEELKSRRNDQGSNVVDEDENEIAEDFELPGADLSNEELTVRVVPRQDDEFTCSECFWYTTFRSLPTSRMGCLYAPSVRSRLAVR